MIMQTTTKTTTKTNTAPYSVHGVLAGAYRGKDLSERTMLRHASQDNGETAVCKRVKQCGLCDWKEAEPVTCPECLARIERRGLRLSPALGSELAATEGE